MQSKLSWHQQHKIRLSTADKDEGGTWFVLKNDWNCLWCNIRTWKCTRKDSNASVLSASSLPDLWLNFPGTLICSQYARDQSLRCQPGNCLNLLFLSASIGLNRTGGIKPLWRGKSHTESCNTPLSSTFDLPKFPICILPGEKTRVGGRFTKKNSPAENHQSKNHQFTNAPKYYSPMYIFTRGDNHQCMLAPGWNSPNSFSPVDIAVLSVRHSTYSTGTRRIFVKTTWVTLKKITAFTCD